MSVPHSISLRRGRFSEPGRIYLLTTVIDQRRPVFANFTLARMTIQSLRECDIAGESATLAFVLMPDHLHWLFQLQGAELSAVARRFKSVSARMVNRTLGTSGVPLWQAGFHDRALRREEDLQGIARYIVANPVRAGLVKSVREYPHWDAVWL